MYTYFRGPRKGAGFLRSKKAEGVDLVSPAASGGGVKLDVTDVVWLAL